MKRSTEDTLALLAGAGIGVAAMYLLDPDTGARRRRQLAAVSREAMDITGETVGPAVGSFAERASRFGRSVADTVGEYGSRLAHGSANLAANTGDAVAETSRSAWHGGKRLVGAEEETHFPVVPTAIGGAGLLALGAAAFWLFDPARGESRRSWLRDKTSSLLRDAGDLARKTGRHISNQAYGTYAETRARFASEPVTDEQLVARVRSELGRVVSNMSNLSVTATHGYVTLIGTIRPDEIQAAEACARAVRGVREVNAQLQPHVVPQQSPQPSGGG